MSKRVRTPSEICVDCGGNCWGRTRSGKQLEPRCHACANLRKPNRAECGTVAAYKRGCRCSECRAATAEAGRSYRASRKEQGLLAQKRRNDRKYKLPETYPNCIVCGETVLNGRVRSDSPIHNACKPSGRQIAISKRRRLAIYERDGRTCQLCHTPVDIQLPWTDKWSATLDHIVPYSLGGSDEESNLRLAHRSCNSRRGAPTEVAA